MEEPVEYMEEDEPQAQASNEPVINYCAFAEAQAAVKVEYDYEAQKENQENIPDFVATKKRKRGHEWRESASAPPQEQSMEQQTGLTATVENAEIIERYKMIEAEKSAETGRSITGPIIQYLSTRVPVVNETNSENGEMGPQFCSKTIISVKNDPDHVWFNKIFNVKPAPKLPKKVKCVVTGLDAKYKDPLTLLPYYNSTCFKIIRFSYYEFLEVYGDRSNLQMATFLEWFARNKQRLKEELPCQEHSFVFSTE